MDQYEYYEYRDYRQRIDLAKDSLRKLISLMDEDKDKLSLIAFNHKIEKIFWIIKKK